MKIYSTGLFLLIGLIVSYGSIAGTSSPPGSNPPPIEIIDSSTVIVDRDDSILETDTIFKLGVYKYELIPGRLSALPRAQLKSGEVALQVGYDAASNRYGVLNGNILVTITNLKNAKNFASSFDLEFVSHFSDIGIVVVKVRDSKYLGQKVLELSSDSRVKNVELDLDYGDILAE